MSLVVLLLLLLLLEAAAAAAPAVDDGGGVRVVDKLRGCTDLAAELSASTSAKAAASADVTVAEAFAGGLAAVAPAAGLVGTVATGMCLEEEILLPLEFDVEARGCQLLPPPPPPLLKAPAEEAAPEAAGAHISKPCCACG